MSLTADIIFYNGNIINPDCFNEEYSYLAVKDEYIVKLGKKDDYERLCGSNSKVYDLKGKSLLPAFIDSHVHFTQTGLNELFFSASDYEDLSSFYNSLIKYASNYDKNDWIIVQNFNPENFDLEQLPDKNKLDQIGIIQPVFVSRMDSHSCALNSKALKLLKIEENNSNLNIKKNYIENGILSAEANSLARTKLSTFISDDMREKAVKITEKMALNKGITFIHALEGGNGLFSNKDLKLLQKVRDSLTIDLKIYPQTMDIEKVTGDGYNQIGGCLNLDGSIGSHTAALKYDYADSKGNRGVLYYSNNKINNFVKKAHEKSLQITTHCIGDRAIEQMLNAYDSVIGEKNIFRHRIEHFSLPEKKQIKRAAELGIIISTQPVFDYYGYYKQDNIYEKRLGENRAKRIYPLKSLLKNGIIVAGGSDSPITPFAPLLNIQAAVNHSNFEERISLYEAIKLFTINAAYAAREEKVRGSLDEGKLADLVVLDKDIEKVKKENIKDINIDMTVKSGSIVK